MNTIDHLIAQGHVHEVDGHAELLVPAEEVAEAVPDTRWQMVEKQVERLAPHEHAMLSVASVAGVDFSAAVAPADGIDLRDGEQWCEALARRGHLLRAHGAAEWPDGTVAGRYAFVHALYQKVIVVPHSDRNRAPAEREMARAARGDGPEPALGSPGASEGRARAVVGRAGGQWADSDQRTGQGLSATR